MRNVIRKVTLAITMLPLLASAPVQAGGLLGLGTIISEPAKHNGLVQLVQAGDQRLVEVQSQVCSITNQIRTTGSRITEIQNQVRKNQKTNDQRFQGLGASARRTGEIASVTSLDELMQGGGAASGNQGVGQLQELVRDLTGRVEDLGAQLSDMQNQMQKEQDDNDFRFQDLEKSKRGAGAAKAQGVAADKAVSAALPINEPCNFGSNQLAAQISLNSAQAEAMNFQLLEMQDQMQKIQEDNERRFQELETGKRSEVGDKGDTGERSVASAAAPDQADASSLDVASADDRAPALPAEDNSADSAAIDSSVPATSGPRRGEEPQQLGSMRMDANGNVIGETVDVSPRPVESGPDGGAGQGRNSAHTGQVIASLPKADDPNALYKAAYQYVLSGDYKAAETGFREHIKRYPADPMTADARYWLGESLYAQERYPEAATVFIDTQRDYPQSNRGPENMLKLGMTLQKMDSHDVACATFEQIPTRYPKASAAVLKRVADERARNHC